MNKAKNASVSAQLPPGIRKLLKSCPDPLDPAALEFTASLLMTKIVSTGRALEAVIARGDPDEILIASSRVGRDLREDATVLRQLQQAVVEINAARSTAPRDYSVRNGPVTIEDGPDGVRVLS